MLRGSLQAALEVDAVPDYEQARALTHCLFRLLAIVPLCLRVLCSAATAGHAARSHLVRHVQRRGESSFHAAGPQTCKVSKSHLAALPACRCWK